MEVHGAAKRGAVVFVSFVVSIKHLRAADFGRFLVGRHCCAHTATLVRCRSRGFANVCRLLVDTENRNGNSISIAFYSKIFDFKIDFLNSKFDFSKIFESELEQ